MLLLCLPQPPINLKNGFSLWLESLKSPQLVSQALGEMVGSALRLPRSPPAEGRGGAWVGIPVQGHQASGPKQPSAPVEREWFPPS